jgi:hypothetical protein
MNTTGVKNLFWSGVSNDERHTAIDNIKSVVSKYGDLVDVHLFSDISLNMKIEIEECKIDRLYTELTPIILLQHFEYVHSASKKERKIYLNITFSKGTGDLKIKVPLVPG